ncbi:RNA polymerase sigma-70 factor [Sunxiuqinia elliptica]|uniref:RNA polymerase sigma-70 factor (ECF subfamily) n=1 Tax=Sunxiuqinia elliptica TaxID=655355 RepID=A0A4R6GRP2_9BACT|nr:RNA polymerase sigma-70 factor [Sunxiuqinia elliptica]TDN97254.1 RNA polymerase sigma-70 factor (ECF subfamily) [Sunxiuqinia elliptica]TDO60563.1 RNA polymerase sigma-70 factor (ECF subfamily) [Sunxiuqinia elliptica]
MSVSPNISDQDLTRLLRTGSKDAFRVLFERYGGRLQHFALSYLKSEHDSEELVQDVFLKLWEKREILDCSGNLRSYIFKVAVNSIYDFIRRKNVEQAFVEFAAGNQAEVDSTWDDVVYNDMVLQIGRLMDKMPEQRRRIFKMSREKGMSNEQIAAELSLSKRTVENQLYRATNFLKKNLRHSPMTAILFYYLFC